MNFGAFMSALKADEGFREKPYLDTEGKLTIGWGRNLADVGITRDEAHAMLMRDAIAAERAAESLIPNWRLIDDVRQGVIANMAFNLGRTKLSRFVKFLAAVNERDYLKAALEMRDSLWFTQVGARAERLAEEMRTGVVR